MNLLLGDGILDQIVRHAQAARPLEGCGLLIGHDRSVNRFVPVTNKLGSPTAYEMDPAELISALRALRESGESLLAIYHSHPTGVAMPSSRDVERAYYPEAAHIIVSLASPESPVVRGFRIVDARAIEIELHVIV